MNETLQSIIVAAIVLAAVIWVICRITRRHKGSDCNCGCNDCPLSQKCDRKDR